MSGKYDHPGTTFHRYDVPDDDGYAGWVILDSTGEVIGFRCLDGSFEPIGGDCCCDCCGDLTFDLDLDPDPDPTDDPEPDDGHAC